jgi:hypothetical protein|tara:strand:+ start:608 stop:790 length:183 start_codon:yes stop_codon:yes gene_type:complete
MEIDEEVILALASKVDIEDSKNLADLFRRLLEQEHAARHQSRPRMVKKFTEMIDDSQGVS